MSSELFNRTVHAVYESVRDLDAWRGCLALMMQYLDAANATIVVRGTAPGDPGHLVCVPGIGEAMARADRGKWHASDPFVALAPERVMLVSDLMTDDQWRASEFFRGCSSLDLPVGAGHVMGVTVATQAGTMALLRLQRLQHAPPFGIEDKERLAMFVPHIKLALTLTAHLSGNELHMKIYEEGLERLNIGVIVLDEEAGLARANRTARHLLDRADGLKLAGRHLAAGTMAETHELQRLLAGVREHPKRVRAMCLTRPSGGRKLAVVLRGFPLAQEAGGHSRPTVALFLRDPDAPAALAHDVARQLFDFTPAEAQLAIELLNGLSLDEAVAKQGILRNTGRAHLRSIFSKTGVSRQSELVRVLLNGVPGLPTMET